MSSCEYIHLSCHKECLLHATLCFQTHLNIINIIIDVKNKKLLLHSVTVTAKSSKKNERRQVKKKFLKLERAYRDCIKRTRDKTRIIKYTA